MTDRTKWFAEAGYGIFVHWTTKSLPEKGERKSHAQAILDFDVETFTNQIIATGAKFLFFTITHSDMFVPFPLPELEELTPGYTSKRDLLGEIADKLEKHDIKLLVYFNGDGQTSPEWRAHFNNEKICDKKAEYCYKITSAISKKYGKKISGWWIDCCYEPGICGGLGLCYDYKKYAEAMRSGNPDSIVAFNFRGVEPWGSEWGRGIADYQAGEENDLTFYPNGRFSGEGGTQWFGLCWMDDYWVHEKEGTPKPVHSNEKVLEYIKKVKKQGGVFAYNVSPYQEGHIAKDTFDQLIWLKENGVLD